MCHKRICPKCGLVMEGGCCCTECGSKTVVLEEASGIDRKGSPKEEPALLVCAGNIKGLFIKYLNKEKVIWMAGSIITIFIAAIILIHCIKTEKSKETVALRNKGPEAEIYSVPDKLPAASNEDDKELKKEKYGEEEKQMEDSEPYQQNYPSVYDEAGLLENSDEARISMRFTKLQDKTDWNSAFTAPVEMEGKSLKEFSDQFYGEAFGGSSGFCIGIDRNSFEAYIGPYGDAAACLTEDQISLISQEFYYLLEAGNYADYIMDMLTEIETCYDTYQSDYILPFSNSTYLTEKDLEYLSQEELRLARNEIYARHGWIFGDVELKEYFNSKPWYHGEVETQDFLEEWLNEYEIANRDLIIQYEQQKGYR